MPPQKPTEKNSDFEKFKRENPGATFATYYVQDVNERTRNTPSRSAIGIGYSALENNEIAEFWSFKEANAALQIKRLRINPSHRLIDFGCGVLRFGCHYMKYLDAGNYCGLDVTSDFFNMGLKIIGREFVREKKPVLAVVSPDSIATASAFGADFVIANEVAYHVHPDENQNFLETLAALTAKPRAILAFNTKISDRPEQLGKNQWSYPLAFYLDNLPSLRNITRPAAFQRAKANLAKGEPFTKIALEFVRN